MTVAAILVKAVPMALAISFVAAALLRFTGVKRHKTAVFLAGGYGLGTIAALLLVFMTSAEVPYLVARGVVALLFGAFFGWSLFSLYRFRSSSTVSRRLQPTLSTAAITGLGAAALFLLRLPVKDEPVVTAAVVLVTGVLSLSLALIGEAKIPAGIQVTGSATFAAMVASLSFISAQSMRLDIFSPLSMKIMKFIHDFVHQGFETLLIPDHPFFRQDVWNYIGFLFSNSVGFWGGLVVWLLPCALVLWMTAQEQLPQVSHIRQGPERRRIIAQHMRDRRLRAVVPLVAALFFALAIYRSVSPATEYWDPKPIKVSADIGGDLVIPESGEDYDLGDGKIHKFLLTGKTPVRFFVLQKDDGTMAVTLDACSICKPDGYGQTEGSVVCYYCNTLIPLSTVGRPGGCNPVPVPFARGERGVQIPITSLLERWNTTVQAVERVPGGEQ